jgi:hypothetical protein
VRPPRWSVAGVVALLTLPGLVVFVDEHRDQLRERDYPVLIDPAESRALDHVADSPAPGAVLSDFYLGMNVPQATGRQSWIGHPTWTPELVERVNAADALFAGRLRDADARATVERSRVRFVIARCGSAPGLRRALAPLVRAVRRFGCVTVYELRPVSA